MFISAELVVVYFDFRLSDIKGVEARGSAPISKEYGKSQPLCALCLPLSRYRRNRLPLLSSESGSSRKPRSHHNPGLTAASLLTASCFPGFPCHRTPVGWSWQGFLKRPDWDMPACTVLLKVDMLPGGNEVLPDSRRRTRCNPGRARSAIRQMGALDGGGAECLGRAE